MSEYDNGSAANARRRKQTQDLTNSKYYELMLAGPVDMDRRLACTNDFRLFCETYGKDAFSLGWSPAHLECIEKIEQATLSSGSFALALPRGSGKSTLCHWAMIWSLLGGLVEYSIYVAATAGSSASRLASLKSTLRFNDLLLEDFPEIIGPIRWCGGEARKAGGQRFDEQTTEIRWGSDKLIFPTLPNFEEHAKWYKGVNPNWGAIMDFASMESGLRGKSVERPDGRVIRPQLAVVDDPQTRESAASPAQVKKRYDILMGDIGYLGSPERPCGVLVPTTIVYEDDLSCKLMDHEKMPQFRGVRYGIINNLPWEQIEDEKRSEEIMVRWEQDYAEIRRFDLLEGTNKATDFYIEHQEEMDGSCIAGWEERKNTDEHSAIQHAMNLYLKDQEAFFAEAMNQPTPLQTGLKPKLRPTDIIARQVNIKPNVCPAECDTITAFIDVSMKCLWWTVVGFNKNSYKAHVINSGVFPDQKKPYVVLAGVKRTIQQRYPDDEYSVALFNSLGDCVDMIRELPIVNESGHRQHVDLIGIDAGWGQESDTVYKFTRRHTASNMLVAMKGFGSTPLKAPLVNPEKKPDGPCSLTGQWKRSQNQFGTNLVIWCVNTWKSRVDNAMRLPLESRSSLSIYGGALSGRKVNIQMLSEQMVAESGILLEGGGRSVEVWKNVGNKDEHLWDCVVGSYLLANMRGVEVQTDGIVRKLKGNTKRRKRRRYRSAE